jgi:hypothetical protein
MPALQPYLSSPFSGNSLRPCYPSERQIIRSAVTGGASQTGRSSRNWCRCWCSGLRLREDRRGGMFGYDAQAPTRRVDRSRSDGDAQGAGS